jgi:hypothetical protein
MVPEGDCPSDVVDVKDGKSDESEAAADSASPKEVLPNPVAPIPTKLTDLLTAAREKMEMGMPQYDIIEWICRVAAEHAIRVRYDDHVIDAASVSDIGSEVADRLSPPQPGSISDKSPRPSESPHGPDEACPLNPDEGKADEGGQARRKLKKGKPIPVQIYSGADGSRVMVLEQILNPGQFDTVDAHGKSMHGLKSSPSVAAVSTSCRLVLSCDRKNVQTSLPICSECNGAVVDTKTWRPLAIPPRAFNPRLAAREVDRLLGSGAFDLIHVDDGTVVTIYRWNHPKYGPIWDLATSNGYGVSTLKWMGSKTYAEVVFEVASMYPEFIQETKASLVKTADGETRIDFGHLDPGKCYTVGFRHHDFHPMRTDPQRMWQIQSVDLLSGVISYGGCKGLPGIPHQVMGDPVRLADEIRRGGLGRPALEKYAVRETSGRDPNLKVEHLIAFGADSLEIARKYIADRKGESAKDASRLPAEIHYGYILRSRNVNITGENSDFLIESSLLKKVRQIVYERPPKNVREDVDHKTRLEFNALRSHLTMTEKDTFEALFPQWRSAFRKYDEFIKNVIHMIRHMHRQNALGPSSRDPPLRTATTSLASALLAHITSHEPLAPFNKDTESVIRDWVINPEYTLLFMRAMASR